MTAQVDAVVLRTAAYPIALLTETLSQPDPRAAVRAVFHRPGPRAALAVASLDLLAALDRDEASDGLDRSLLQYLIRMTTRPSPYGLFAAVATGSLGAKTDLLVVPELRASAHLAIDAVPRAHRSVRPTPTAYEVGGQIRYVEDHRRLVAAQLSPALRAALSHPSGDHVARDLAKELGVRETTAELYVDELLAAGLLVDDPAVTGPAYDEQVGFAVPTTGTWERRIADTAHLLGRAPSARLLVVDAVRDGRGVTIDAALVARLHRGVDLVRRLTPRRTPPALRRFSREFRERWPGRWLPVLHALDPDVGIGFGGGDTGWSDPSGAAKLRLLTRALRDGVDEIDLQTDDLDDLSVPDPAPLPQAYAVVARLDSEGDLHLRTVNGPPGSRLLGRFARADPALADALRRHHAAEAARHPGAVVAEIAHLPAGRAGNVVSRPVVRDTEIVLLAAPGAARTIRPADLLVGVVAGEVQLRLADGTRVLPRMATAHRYDGADLPLYRFLCDMQASDGSTSLGWNWGQLQDSAFLPRVRAGDVVLAPRTWQRPRAGDLPRWVVLVEDHRELVLDLESSPCRDLLAARPAATVRELWPTPDRMAAHGTDGRYVSELVVAFTQTGPVRPEPKITMAVGTGRRHLPGGEWLSLKVYCGAAAADAILVAARPLLAGRDWWFIRYADPDHHLRIRVRDGLDLLAGFHDLLDRPDVVRVQVDTYEPEVERYGGPDLIQTAEQLFAADSRALVDLLPIAAEARWRLTVAAVDALWGDAELARIERIRDTYAREHRFTTGDRRAIGQRFRAERTLLENVDDPVLDRRSSEIAPLLAMLPDRVVPSLAHMTVNRWLRSQQREQEAVIYDILARIRRSRQARQDSR